MNETATQQDRNCPLREKQQLGIAFSFVRFSEFFVKKTKCKKAVLFPYQLSLSQANEACATLPREERQRRLVKSSACSWHGYCMHK